ncbi:hypothetical protein V1264_005500 [Littorina saxatilis]|uniref:Apple domain-containing protein n=1 Tax=Littorina saxatilis TaxID=31220 RepID=A0AAN9G659_9CAEN
MPVSKPLATVFIVFILHVHLVTSQVRSAVFSRQTGLAGVLFTEHILFSSKEVAKGACASRCLQTARCLSFTFTGVNCQGHGKMMVFSDVSITEVGAETFAVKEKEEWLQNSCSIDADCSNIANVRCRRNTCVCTPGYFYSESLNQCVTDCAVSSLTPNFILYDHAGIIGHNVEEQDYVHVDVESCNAACVQYGSCLTTDWNSDTTKCNLQVVTALTDPGSYQDNEVDWLLSQRNCQ